LRWPRLFRALRSLELSGEIVSGHFFGTIQGRLPQELALAGVKDHAAANAYLQKRFIPDFNRRFTVKPESNDSAFLPLAGIDLDLLLSAHHDRVVQKDSTVVFEKLHLQLPPGGERSHYIRCPGRGAGDPIVRRLHHRAGPLVQGGGALHGRRARHGGRIRRG
jgi:hypothetical protein